MSQNFTIDDTDATLVYGPGWGVASPDDLTLNNYFQSTYHASQTQGANVNLSFSGIAIYLFGSKGPNHGNFSIRYDNFVQLLSTQADTPSYRQLLFSIQFPPGDHSITLTNTDNNHSWLDLDYLTFTVAGNSSESVPSNFPSTISPLPVASSTTQIGLSSTLSPSPSVVQASSSNSNNTPVVLAIAIAFGILLFFFVIAVAWYFIRRGPRRGGKLSQASHGANTPANSQFLRSAGTAFLSPQSFIAQHPLPPHPSTFDHSHLQSPTTNLNIVNNNAPEHDSSLGMRQWPNSTPGHSSPSTRPWSPFSTPISRMFGSQKNGADSMKSTFLKV